MHAEPAETRPPASRRARIIVWSVLIAGLVVVLATPLAIFACLRYSASQKAANVEALEDLGAWVSERSPEEEPSEWLVQLLGKENFRYVDNVEIGEIETSPNSREARANRADTEEFLQRVRQFPRVRSLFISTEQVRGQELRELPFFGKLKNLTVYCPEFTVEDAQIFRELEQPESIGIGSNRLTDAGMAALQELRGMEMILIRGPKVSLQGKVLHAEGVTQQSPGSRRQPRTLGNGKHANQTLKGFHRWRHASHILCNAFSVTAPRLASFPGCAGRPATLGFAV